MIIILQDVKQILIVILAIIVIDKLGRVNSDGTEQYVDQEFLIHEDLTNFTDRYSE